MRIWPAGCWFSLPRERQKNPQKTHADKNSGEFIESRLFARQYNGGCELFRDAFVAAARTQQRFKAPPIQNWVYWKTLIGRARVRENRQRHNSQQRPFECAKSPTIEQRIKPRPL
jgi:hypothetical protein